MTRRSQGQPIHAICNVVRQGCEVWLMRVPNLTARRPDDARLRSTVAAEPSIPLKGLELPADPLLIPKLRPQNLTSRLCDACHRRDHQPFDLASLVQRLRPLKLLPSALEAWPSELSPHYPITTQS